MPPAYRSPGASPGAIATTSPSCCHCLIVCPRSEALAGGLGVGPARSMATALMTTGPIGASFAGAASAPASLGGEPTTARATAAIAGRSSRRSPSFTATSDCSSASTVPSRAIRPGWTSPAASSAGAAYRRPRHSVRCSKSPGASRSAKGSEPDPRDRPPARARSQPAAPTVPRRRVLHSSEVLSPGQLLHLQQTSPSASLGSTGSRAQRV